jgi:hypothetical protein
MKTIRLLLLLLMPSYLLIACSNDENIPQLTGIVWKCKGFVNTSEGSLTQIHPKQETMPVKNYTILFETSGNVEGYTGANTFKGMYTKIGNRLKLYEIERTLVGIIGENVDYENILFNSIETYELSNKELLLYFDNGKKYLLFYPL